MPDDFVTLVSGVPRSGTSLVMQMLAAGGMPVMTDDRRAADADNPRGYLEFEPVKRLRQDSGWMQQAAGHAIKVIYHFLYDLPPDLQYRVLFVRRDLAEVVASQRAMLERNGKPGGPPDAEMITLFTAELRALHRWLPTQPQFAMLDVPYQEVVQQPRQQAQRIQEFLGQELDVESMAATVDPQLHRQRAR